MFIDLQQRQLRPNPLQLHGSRSAAMNSRTDGSTADNPVGVAHQGVDTTRYFRVTLVLQNKTHQEFIFILHSDVLGKEMYGVELLSTKVAFYF